MVVVHWWWGSRGGGGVGGPEVVGVKGVVGPRMVGRWVLFLGVVGVKVWWGLRVAGIKG